MLKNCLRELVNYGILKDFDLVDVSDDGVVGEKSKFRNSQRLTLVFKEGARLVIQTFCSGSAEDTMFIVPE
jgi:hypothetical protein